MKKVNILAVFLILSSTHFYSQVLDTTNWFPYKTGNMWEYYVIEEISLVDTFQIFNIKDSVDENGIIHLTQYSRYINPIEPFTYNKFYIDTVNQFVYGNYMGFGFDSVLIYKFNAKSGDQWVMMAFPNGGGEMARVTAIYQDNIFGINTTFMDMHYYGAADTTDTTGLDRYGATLAKGFGLYYFGGGESLFRNFLAGTIIDSILYGDTTQIVTSVVDDTQPKIPESLELLQNYPNPFNPYTTIKFRVKSASDISLIIYDNSGKEVKNLLANIFFLPGEYQITWDGRNEKGIKTASGIYFYRLSNGHQNLVRSMILLK